MATSSKSTSFHKILILVFGIAFGIVALALAYQGVKTSSDIRSRAALGYQIYKWWGFDGSSTEGWNAIFPYTASVKGGVFVLSAAKANAIPMFQNTKVGVPLPKGLKTVSLSMAVGPVRFPSPPTPVPGKLGGLVKTVQTTQEVSGVTVDPTFQRSIGKNAVCALDVRTCPDGSTVGRSGNGCSFMPCPVPGVRKFTAYIVYKLVNKDAFERPVQFTGVADGLFKTYTINLPNVEKITIDSMLVVLASGVKNKEAVAVDWIRILGPIVIPTPTPTPAVNTCTAQNVAYVTSGLCKPGTSTGVSYSCPDGYQGSWGYRLCTANSTILSAATNYCIVNNHCLRPTPPTCTPIKVQNISYGVSAETPCPQGYAMEARYVCTDNYTGLLSGTTCILTKDLLTKVTAICSSRSKCGPTPPPTYYPPPNNTPIPSYGTPPPNPPNPTGGPIPSYGTPPPKPPIGTPTPTPMTPTIFYPAQ